METKTRQKHKKHILLWIGIILLIPCCVMFGIYLYLPFILESALPPVARLFGVANFAMKVHKFTWDDIEVREVKSGSAANSGLYIRKIKFIRSKNTAVPNKIIISNAAIEAYILKGKVFIPGIIFPFANPTQDQKAVALTSLLSLPASLSTLTNPSLEVEIRNSEISITHLSRLGEHNIKLPLNIKFSIDKNGSFDLKVDSITKELREIPYLPAGVICGTLNLSLEAEGILYENKPCDELFAKFAISLKDVKYNDSKNSAAIPEIKLDASLWQESEDLFGEISAKFAKGSFQTEKVNLTQISMDFPFDFQFTDKLILPSVSSDKSGILNVGQINIGGKNRGNARLEYKQKGNDLHIKGRAVPIILQGKQDGEKCDRIIAFDGKVQLPLADEDFDVSCHFEFDCPKVKLNIGEFASQMNDIVFDGNIKLESDFTFSRGKPAVSANLAIIDSRIEHEEKGLSVEKLNLGFYLPDLMDIRSAPAQKLTFDSFEYGTIKLGKGDLQFQLESKKTLFLEKSEFEWCDGQIDFGAVRVDFNKPENLDFTFYCNRINVAEFLNQLSIATGSGDGEVTGSIPVVFNDGHLVIKDGFLYSTPGEGASIQLIDFKGSNFADTNVQLAIARESLKDFKYKWIRLHFHSEDKNLLLKLELDGAPAGQLPFTFDFRKGLLKSDNPNKKATFQGISFEINYNLPIDDLIYYGRKTSDLFQ